MLTWHQTFNAQLFFHDSLCSELEIGPLHMLCVLLSCTHAFAPVDTLMGALPAHFESDEEFARRLAALEAENEAARAELRAAAKEGGMFKYCRQ